MTNRVENRGDDITLAHDRKPTNEIESPLSIETAGYHRVQGAKGSNVLPALSLTVAVEIGGSVDDEDVDDNDTADTLSPLAISPKYSKAFLKSSPEVVPVVEALVTKASN